MNENNHTTRLTWRKAYRLARLSESCSDDARSLAARHVRYVALNTLYVQALTAIAARHSHTAALMTRPLPRSLDAEWLVNTRCNRYAATSGRLPG